MVVSTRSASLTTTGWEPKLQRWSVGPGKTEEEQMEHAVTAIRSALDRSPTLAPHVIEVLPTGSFRNRTHIPTESDVDVAVIYKDVFVSEWDFADARAKTEPAVVQELMREAGVTTSPYTYAEYKNQVEAALVDHFGRANVERGDKAFDITENTYRVESDCVAMFQHRQWVRNAAGRLVFTEGTMFFPDSDPSKEILNYPKQQYANGEAKHVRTGRRYKKMVRIIKNLCNEMADAGIAAARPIPSFLIECLVYQVPDGAFGRPTFYEELQLALASIATRTKSDDTCEKWTEVNEIKFLFHPTQGWTREEAHDFAMSAFAYISES
jgi:Nucleotidyltransferase domain